MEHDRDEVKEKKTEAPAGRCECSQQHKDPHWDRTKHPEKARELVSFVNMSQAGNDTKDNCDGVARFAFGRFSRAARPITSVTPFDILRQKMPAVWTGHFIPGAWFGASGRCVCVLYAHFSH
jgi:hypothetical protein